MLRIYTASRTRPLPSASSTGQLTALVALSVLGAAMVLWNLKGSLRGRPTLILSPRSIDYRYPGERTFNIAWDEIVEIADHPAQNRRKAKRAIMFQCADGTRAVITSAGTWVPGGASLYDLCRHYWLNPADRGELAKVAALERLARRRVSPRT